MAEYASWGTGAGALSTGIIGTALGVLNGAGGLLGMAHNGGTNGGGYVTKDELKYVQEIAQKDSEIALLKSEQNTEIKIADVYERIMTRVNADRREQDAWNCQQMTNNANMANAIARNADSISALQGIVGGITRTIVPRDVICPEVMRRYNSWEAPTEPAPNAIK